MGEHTPGPWKFSSLFRPDTGLGQRVAIVDPPEMANDGMVVCWAMGPDKEANARLIAAAPDLLDALKAVLAEWREGYGLNCLNQVTQAIRKAEEGALPAAPQRDMQEVGG